MEHDTFLSWKILYGGYNLLIANSYGEATTT